MARRGVQHWKKRKAIAAYLFRRRWWAITLELNDSITLSELVDIEAPGQHSAAYADNFGFTETLNFASSLDKTEVINILESLSLSVTRDLATDSIGMSEILSSNFSKAIEDATADNATLSDQLDIIFNLAGLTDDITFTNEVVGKTIFKTLSDGFGIAETINSKETTINKTDGVIINHSETADVVISGTFANRKLGGEPFNTLTFN